MACSQTTAVAVKVMKKPCRAITQINLFEDFNCGVMEFNATLGDASQARRICDRETDLIPALLNQIEFARARLSLQFQGKIEMRNGKK